MKSYIGTLLDRGGWKAYEGWLLSRICEVMDQGREHVLNDPCGNALEQGLAHMEAIDVTDVIADGTPFFWMNVRRLCGAQGQTARTQKIRDFLMTAFDAYFHMMPDGACFTLPNSEPQAIILPRLGVAIPNASRSVLRRLSSRTLEIESATEKLAIDLTGYRHNYRTCTGMIFNEGSERIIATAEPSIMSKTTDIATEADVRAFSDQIVRGMTMIESVDGELYGSIRKLIRWFVPLRMPEPFLHYSRTAGDMTGVIYLSEGYSGIRLCEAIIHEFHHNELFALETTQRLAKWDDNPVFYSPWRGEPRPLSGLLHALHVFSGVVNFYRMAECTNGLDSYREEVHHRRSELCQRLRIAISQVPQQALTSLGNRFMQVLTNELVQHQNELQLTPQDFSAEIRSHARTWCEINRDYVQYLKWPDRHTLID